MPVTEKSSARLTPKLAPPEPDKDTRDPLSHPVHQRYRKLRSLNDGSAGFVQLAEDKHSKEKVAIKFLKRGTKVIKDADREICNLRLCCMHPYVIRFKEVRYQLQALHIFFQRSHPASQQIQLADLHEVALCQAGAGFACSCCRQLVGA